jgi:hypothetical protein
MKRLARGIVVVAWLASPACGGSSGTAADAGAHGGAGATGGAGHDGGVPTGAITWLDDGTPRALSTAEAVRRTDKTGDTLEIVGVDLQGIYNLTIAVAGPMALAGPYTCSTANGNADLAEITYTQKVLMPSTCTVTVVAPTPADGGTPHVTGTFSFDITKEAGTESITDGRFDLPVTTEAP